MKTIPSNVTRANTVSSGVADSQQTMQFGVAFYANPQSLFRAPLFSFPSGQKMSRLWPTTVWSRLVPVAVRRYWMRESAPAAAPEASAFPRFQDCVLFVVFSKTRN